MDKIEEQFTFYAAKEDDIPFMEQMLVDAAAASGEFIKIEELDNYPDTARYVRSFPQNREVGVIAETKTGAKAGAAWIRLFSHLEDMPLAPEITIGVSENTEKLAWAAI